MDNSFSLILFTHENIEIEPSTKMYDSTVPINQTH